MTETKTRVAYDAWHDRLDVDAASDAPWHQLVKAHCALFDLTGKKVFEIGCGRGGFACWLASRSDAGATVSAADFSLAAVAKGRQFADRCGIHVRWEVADIQAIPHQDEIFDFVVSCETVEHVPSPKKAVRELSRVLKPGGTLFLTTPNYLGLMGLYRAYRRLSLRPFTEEGQPINNFMTLPRTLGLIASAGLTVRAIDGTGHYLPFPGRPPIEMPKLNNPRRVMRWIALHSLVVAEKPQKT